MTDDDALGQRIEENLPHLAEASGSTGDQAPPPSESMALVRSEPMVIDDRHVGAALSDFGASRSPAVQNFAIALYRDAQESSIALARKLEVSEAEKSDLREELGRSQRVVAVFRERITANSRLQRIQTLGGALIGSGLAISFAASTLMGLGGALLIIGALLIVLSLGGSDKEAE